MDNQLILDKKTLKYFRDWLNLNLEELTWQGRYKNEFENFWSSFFEENLSITDLIKRFEYCETELKTGSLYSWIVWLKHKFINFLFIHSALDIFQIAKITEQKIYKISTILRNFFCDHYPHLEQSFSHIFLVQNICSQNINLNYDGLKKQLPLFPLEHGSLDDEIMPSMEITLYEEWSPFVKKMRSDFHGNKYDAKKIQEKIYFKNQIKVLQTTLLLFFGFSITIFSIRNVNRWYEKYLANQVSIYEPNFSWIDKNYLFKPIDQKPLQEFKLNYSDIKDITKGESITEFFDPESYSEESEATLTSVENLPKDLDDADGKTSEFQEKSAGPNGYRETKAGNVRIYRVMMNSSNTVLTKDKLQPLLTQYEVTQVDNVKPGTDVPGGVYYNVFVPKKRLKEFVSEVLKVDESKLYENTTNVNNTPPGMIRVFIWVKKI